MHKKEISILIISVIILFVVNYNFLNSAFTNWIIQRETVFIRRVIDGDTIVADNQSIRLLGINSPEKGEKYYNEAKEFLEQIVSNKTVGLEFGKERYDLYYRILAYVFIQEKNINLELIRSGFANFYFPSGKDLHYSKFKKAWEECIKNNRNLCEKSEDICGKCVVLKEFNYQNEIIILKNICNLDCDLTKWNIKDEGRKNFVFPEFILEKGNEMKIIVGEGLDSKENLFWKGEEYVWTKSGDTLFLRDSKGRLVLWESY